MTPCGPGRTAAVAGLPLVLRRPRDLAARQFHVAGRYRILALTSFGSGLAQAVGQLSAPLLAAAFGAPAVAVTGGLVAAGAMLAASSLRRLRSIEIRPEQ